MKGWVKGMIIGAVACIGTGTVLCMGAWAMGGRFAYFRNRGYGLAKFEDEREALEEMARADREREEAAYEAEAVIEEEGAPDRSVGAGQDGALGTKAAVSGGQAKSGATVVRQLEIEVAGGLVEIVADPSTDQIVVTSSDEDYRCRQELDEDKLEIYVGLNTGMDFWDADSWIDGSLWKDWVEDLDEEKPAAQIRIPAGADFRQVDLAVKAGEISMSQVTAEKLDLEVKAGYLEVSGGAVQELDGECKAGELIYEGQVGREMEAECNAGSIQYRIEGSQEDFWYQVEAAAGSILIDGQEKGVLNRESVIENPGAAKKAKLECTTGAIDVSFQ